MKCFASENSKIWLKHFKFECIWCCKIKHEIIASKVLDLYTQLSFNDTFSFLKMNQTCLNWYSWLFFILISNFFCTHSSFNRYRSSNHIFNLWNFENNSLLVNWIYNWDSKNTQYFQRVQYDFSNFGEKYYYKF